MGREGCIQELSIQAISEVENEDLGHVGAANNLGIVKLKIEDSIYGIKRKGQLDFAPRERQEYVDLPSFHLIVQTSYQGALVHIPYLDASIVTSTNDTIGGSVHLQGPYQFSMPCHGMQTFPCGLAPHLDRLIA